jgi:hypothetical protein
MSIVSKDVKGVWLYGQREKFVGERKTELAKRGHKWFEPQEQQVRG